MTRINKLVFMASVLSVTLLAQFTFAYGEEVKIEPMPSDLEEAEVYVANLEVTCVNSKTRLGTNITLKKSCIPNYPEVLRQRGFTAECLVQGDISPEGKVTTTASVCSETLPGEKVVFKDGERPSRRDLAMRMFEMIAVDTFQGFEFSFSGELSKSGMTGVLQPFDFKFDGAEE